jgi:hypothetical protein
MSRNPTYTRPKKPKRQATVKKITFINPSDEIISQSAHDLQLALEKQTDSVFQRALAFLTGEKHGIKTFRTKPIVITVEKP